jgi:hypothetical protein
MKLSQAKFSCPEPIKVNGKAKVFNIHVKGKFFLDPKIIYQYGQFEEPTFVGFIDQTFEVVNKRQLKKIISISLYKQAVTQTGKSGPWTDDIRYVWFHDLPHIYDEQLLKQMEEL